MPKKSNGSTPPTDKEVELAEKSAKMSNQESEFDEVDEILSEFKVDLFAMSDELVDIGICTCCLGNVLVDVAAWYFSHGKEHTKYKTKKLFLREAKDAIKLAYEARQNMEQEQ